MPNATTTSEIDKALAYLLETIESQGHGATMLIAILHELTDLITEARPIGDRLGGRLGDRLGSRLGGALTAKETAFLIESAPTPPNLSRRPRACLLTP